jgi:branched-chain amino acid aminotransferase
MAGSQDFISDPRNDRLVVLVNGALVPREQATVSVFDAGFGVGDGVWEGVRLHRRSMLFLDAHLDRLWRGAAAIRLDIGQSRDDLVADLVRLLNANGMTDGAHLRIMVTRGVKRTINQDPRAALGRATIVATAEFKQRGTALARGLNLATVSIRCTPPSMFDMRLNSHSRLNLITALLEAIDAGADEALMLDPQGHVASCNATNFFWVRGGAVYTSSDLYCFNGITRGNVIALCRDGVAPLHMGDFSPDALLHADEAFVTGTMGGVTPVAMIDNRPLPQIGGPVTRRIEEAYAALKDTYAAGTVHL